MLKNGLKLLDSDMHVMEPPDLWQRYLDAGFRDQAPRGLLDSPLDIRMAHPDGRLWGRSADRTRLSGGPPGHMAARTEPIYRPYVEEGWSARAQLRAMDAEGIDVTVLFPSRGLHALGEPGMKPELAAAVARAYNHWLNDFCQEDPRRLFGAGMVSVFDIEDAVAEVRRCVKDQGCRAIFLRPNEVGGRNWHDPYYEPLWSSLDEMDVALGFHEAAFSALRQVGEQFGAHGMLRHVFCHPGEQMLATASFCLGGILERHPRLRVAFLEGNCSWLPFLLWRMDEHWEQSGDVWTRSLKAAPSEYFKRQCYASAEADETPLKYVIDYVGDRNVVFSTDFPHPDSKFPHAAERFMKQGISDAAKERILWDNCAALYGIKNGKS